MIGIGSEALIFLYAVLGGMAVFSAYCVLICFRRIIKHGRALTGLEDILFWIGAWEYKMVFYTWCCIRSGAGIRPALSGEKITGKV